MLHNIFKHLGGIEHYGIVSLCLFCIIFTGVLVWAFMQRKPHLDRMAQVPLDAESDDQPALGNTETRLSNHE